LPELGEKEEGTTSETRLFKNRQAQGATSEKKAKAKETKREKDCTFTKKKGSMSGKRTHPGKNAARRGVRRR